MEKAIMKEDKFSTRSDGKSFKRYAAKGERVIIVSWHDEVAICEKANGDRFSAPCSILKIIK